MGEAQPGNCPISEQGTDYAINHTPFVYDTRTQTTLCPQNARHQAGKTAIIITWDEGNNSSFLVPLIVLTPYTSVKGASHLPQLLSSPE